MDTQKILSNMFGIFLIKADFASELHDPSNVGRECRVFNLSGKVKPALR
jgi:hypothetical protein